MLKKATSLTLLCLFPSLAFAQEIECAEGWPTRCSARVEAGKKAPFTGQLMTDDMAIFLGQSTAAVEKRIQAAVTRTASTAESRRRRDLAIAAADMRVVEAERDAYKRAASRPWIEHPAVVATLAVAGTVLLYFAAVETVKLARGPEQ